MFTSKKFIELIKYYWTFFMFKIMWDNVENCLKKEASFIVCYYPNLFNVIN